MASSSAPNIFSGSMSFSLETCRMTDGSMIMEKPFSSVHPCWPQKVESRHPNIAETDIIDFAILLINDREEISLDRAQRSRETPRGRCGARRSGAFQRLGIDRILGRHADSPPGEANRILQGIELSVQPSRGDLECVSVGDLVGGVEKDRNFA